MTYCKNCEGRGALETGIGEASSIQCRRCNGTGEEPEIKELLRRRMLKEHGGEYEPMDHHWNLIKHDSMLHRDALARIEDLERALNHLRYKHAFRAKPEKCVGNPSSPESCYRVRCQLGGKCAEAQPVPCAANRGDKCERGDDGYCARCHERLYP